jgi:hypothetical protein
MSYDEFLTRRSQIRSGCGFDPDDLPDKMFPFQQHLTRWALQQGRAAIFADCGLGKTFMQLTWADKIVKKCNKPVMIVTPLAVGAQTVAEAARFSIEAVKSKNGDMPSSAQIVVTNYEQLPKYDPLQFAGCVCDESSAIKDFKTERKAVVAEFMRLIQYRLLCTATAAPNDFWELGTSSEVLGHLGFRDMITQFFKQETAKDYLGWGRTKYRFRGHAEHPFWNWICSWARSLRMPSDLGFADDGFVLPTLTENTVVVNTATPRKGVLFTMPARDMREERAERRHSIDERVAEACRAVEACESQSIIWGELNEETDAIERSLDDCVQVSGSTPDDEKEESFLAFANGQIKRLVTKAKIGAWGLNFQNCANVVVFPSHSYEQYYQLVRRCYRFGQTNPVTVTRILCEGERGIIDNLQRKQDQATAIFSNIVAHMKDALLLKSRDSFHKREEIPSWLSTNK